ncbi:MAG: hypothetical protein HY830_23255 [Actinobacteria bacterium]|nr:hypothetical protein [Actinomycetota bacterium]
MGTGTEIDAGVLAATRRSLHGVAEMVVAGPQHRRFDTIRLLVAPGGFRGLHLPLHVDGTTLRFDGGSVPLAGTYRGLAEAAGVDVGVAVDLYTDVTGIDPDEEVVVDAAAAAHLADCWARGDAALRVLAPESSPILWPEHFDVGITVDQVNYGLSPGDGYHPSPYAYVGPWTPRTGEFWNAPFGAARPVEDLPDAAAVAAFFAEGRDRAAS